MGWTRTVGGARPRPVALPIENVPDNVLPFKASGRPQPAPARSGRGARRSGVRILAAEQRPAAQLGVGPSQPRWQLALVGQPLSMSNAEGSSHD